MLKQETTLELMKGSFPSWSDIRKRTKRALGGKLLMAYSNEFNIIQQAIEDYQKLFFLASFDGVEDKVIDYLNLAFVGKHDDFKMVEPECKITEYVSEFYDNLDSMVLYQGGYILIHEKLLGERTSIIYSAGGYEYESKCSYEHIWNYFDEFALFAGLERQDGEKNRALATRTYDVFRNFPNASCQGLKNAIANAMKDIKDIDPESIDIIPIDKDHLDMKDEQMAKIYEDFLQYNRDVFRAKVWNNSLWEHPFQKTDFIPHIWDADMEITQDGVGSNDSLKIDYIKHLNENDVTDIRVDAYKKDFETIRQYIGKSNVEASLQLTLTKYSDDINPKDVTVKIHAYDAVKLENPENIIVQEMQKCTGESTFYIDDIYTRLYNVTRIDSGKLEKETKYKLRFTPTSSFSDMSISKCSLIQNGAAKDLRIENGAFKMQQGVLRNTRVLAHIDTSAELNYSDNITSPGKGFVIGGEKDEGTLGFDVTGMGGQMVNCDITCRPVDICGSEYMEASGFVLDADRHGYTDSSSSSLGYINIGGNKDYKLSCNTYSFELAASSDLNRQGAIEVTVVANGKVTKTIYSKPCTVTESFDENTQVNIIIKKYGSYPVQVRNIRVASYDVEFSLSDGSALTKVGSVMRLPKDTNGKTLKMRLIPHTSSYPVVNYIHVGLSLTGSRYELDFTTGTDDPILDIDTDCDVTLYKLDGSGKQTLVGTEKMYSTKATFTNNTSSQGQIVINTGDFTNIVGSSPKIYSKFKGTTQDYIILEPGESITTMMIDGNLAKTLASKSLAYYITNGVYAGWEFYVTNGAANAMFIKNTSTGKASRVTIPKDKFNYRADTFKVTGLPANVSVKYASATGESKISNTPNNDAFDEVFLISDKSVDHVAYNDVSMVSEFKDGVEMVNTFAPLISTNAMMVYVVEQALNSTDEIKFGTSGADWSFGVDPLGYSVKTTLETKNAETWVLEINHINNKYILDNEIPLEEKYLIDGVYHELAEYVVEPEKGLQLDYRSGSEIETVVANNVASKLRYSNLKNVKLFIGNTQITTGFTIMAKEGLILWEENNPHNGKEVRVTYTVMIPETITYTGGFIDRLYGLVSFKAEAYKHIGSKDFVGLADGDIVPLDIAVNADRLITKCNNPCFRAVINGGKIFVSQVKEEDKIAVHNGYIYDAGQEYWYFNDKFDDNLDRYINVELHDVRRLADKWLFHMASTNYLPYTSMTANVMSKLCAIDFTRRLPVPISEFYHLTACDSYNLWYFIGMKGEIVANSFNGYGIKFTSTDSANGYAAAEITRFMKKGNVISLYVQGDITVSIVEETTIAGMSFAKSICFDAKNAIKFNTKGDFRYYVIDKEPKEFTRYYLYVEGKSGEIDDMISMPYKDINEMVESHTKNIDRLAYKIAEALPKNYEYDVEFEKAGCQYDDLQIDSRTGEIATSSTIEYGLTKIESSDMSRCYLKGAVLNKGQLTLSTDGALVKTRSFYVRNKSNVYELDIKVNDIAVGKYRDFTIKVYGSSSENGVYILLKEETKTNIVTLPSELVKSYIYIEVTGRKNSVIYGIETYARYAERDAGAKLVPIQKTSGELITKIYDLGTSADYRFDGVDADIAGEKRAVQYYVRGAKEDGTSIVFTDWKMFDEKATGLNKIVLKGYKLFQFKVALLSKDVAVTIRNFKLTVV